jgi:hypothetical protein
MSYEHGRLFTNNASGMAKVASTMRENNDSFVVSVEGRRSLDGNLSPFKKVM